MARRSRTHGLAASGVAGLDEILGGGFPPNRLYLVQGNPGAGKTTLALQFLLEGLRRGESCLYVTLSESDEEVTDVARSHGWSLDGLERVTLDTVDGLIRGAARTTVFHPSEMELEAVSGLVAEAAQRIKPDRVVFDSLSEFRLLAESALRYRHQLLELKRLFSELRSTVLLLDDMNSAANATDPHVLSLAHGVVDLTRMAPEYGAPRRRLQASKMRAAKVQEGYHDFTIRTGGLEVYPRLRSGDHSGEFHPQSIPSGNLELDSLLGGGVDRGTTSLIMGPAGTGKSTLALLYAAQLVRAGERVMYFTFDESLSIALTRARALGMDFTTDIESGRLVAVQVDPPDMTPGEFAHRVRRGVEDGAAMVILDSLNGYLQATPGERYLINHLHELSSYLNQQGVATLLILTMHGWMPEPDKVLELSYLADMAVSLRFFEAWGEVRRAIAVVKKRSGAHESTIREIRLVTGGGIELGQPLTEFTGILAGTPQFHGKSSHMLGR